MSYLETLITERRARMARLNNPTPVPPRGPRVRIIPIVNGRQWFPPPPPPPERPLMPKPIPPALSPYPSVPEIVCAVAYAYNVSRADILARNRRGPTVLRRHVAMYLASQLSGRSLPEIGRQFGGYDHSSVIHARDNIERRLGTDEGLAVIVLGIKAALAETVRRRNAK
jgi:hypothetical protein